MVVAPLHCILNVEFAVKHTKEANFHLQYCWFCGYNYAIYNAECAIYCLLKD